MAYLDEVVAQAKAWDQARPRSGQKQLGWSGLAGCRAHMGFKVRDDWESDQTDTWRAIVGTALHEWITGVRYEALLGLPPVPGPYGVTYKPVSFEVAVSYGGVDGHADEVRWDTGEVTDYKFPSLASARVWDDPEVLDERFIQVMGYCAGVMETEAWAVVQTRNENHGRNGDGPLARLLVCPVNGTFDDWRCYERPFDRKVADDALRRYQLVLDAVEDEAELPRDKPEWWCSRWCEFYSACRGGSPPELEEITDEELAAAVERYGLAAEAESAAKAVKKDLHELIDGLSGTARGWRTYRTRQAADDLVPDSEAMARWVEDSGRMVPYKTKPGRPPHQRVVRDKEKK